MTERETLFDFGRVSVTPAADALAAKKKLNIYVALIAHPNACKADFHALVSTYKFGEDALSVKTESVDDVLTTIIDVAVQS